MLTQRQIKEMVKQNHQRSPLKNTLYNRESNKKRALVHASGGSVIVTLVNKFGWSYADACSYWKGVCKER